MPDSTDLLGEIATLKAMLIASEARNLRKDERIERLEKLVAAFRQATFGRRSEKSDPDQFELALEDLEAAMAVIHAEEDTEDRAAKRPTKPRAANRGSLPKHLPRIEEVIEPESLADLKRSTKLFMDETRAPVLDPGTRKTKTGYFWALACDERPWGGTAPPGVAFTYAPGRGGQHAERILQGFGGVLQVDGYAGYNRLIAPDRVGPGVQLAHCWAHAFPEHP